MGKKRRFLCVVCLMCGLLAASGCVERKLTIVTEPKDAVVWLNDEEIGVTPVTVAFNWYGDYNVRIEKPGYEIVNTHRLLERPVHDRFPLDFFAEVLWPGTIRDDYTWTFPLQLYQPASPEELIKSASDMRQKADQELGKIAIEILEDKK
ncbi:MAG: PEGA domain-containing protein [Planctomycetales bacterium]|nr:PEGA domain-containing protein [Planctomycetales bacterium]